MIDSVNNAAPVIRSLPIDSQALGKAPVDSKQAMSTGSVGPRLDAQVLQAGATMTQYGYTEQQLDDMAGAAFTETDNFLADLAKKEEAKQGLGDTAKSSLTFDPGVWEKHLSVLVSIIDALNVARRSSAAMSGVFTQLAFKAAEAQGVAIKAGGEAAMRAALGGAVVAGVMAVGGAGLSIRGHAKQHGDIKRNKVESTNRDKQGQEARVNLQKTPSVMTSEPKKASVTPASGASGASDEIEQINKAKADAPDRALLEAEVRDAVTKSRDAAMRSQLNQKSIERYKTIGGTLGGLANNLSAAVNSTVRLEEYNQRQAETLHGAEQSVKKSVSDAANQAVSEDSAMLAKQQETLRQIAEGRNSVISTIANARA